MTSPAQSANDRNPLYRSPLFWRLLSGPLIAMLMLLIVSAATLSGLTSGISQVKLLHGTARTSTALLHFSGAVTALWDHFDALSSSTFNADHFAEPNDQATAARRAVLLEDVPTEQRPALAQILATFDQLQPQLRQINDAAKSDRTAAGVRWQNGKPSPAEQLTTLIQQNQTAEKAITTLEQQYFKDIENGQQAGLLVVPLTLVSGLLVAATLVGVFLNRIVRRVTALGVDIKRLAEGDLRVPTRLMKLIDGRHGRDEITALEYAYVRAIERLRRPLYQIQQDAGRISNTSVEISAASNAQAASSNQQATAITEVTVTVEQLNQTAMQIAEAAASVAAAAEQALLSAGHGQEAVRDSIIGMAMIRSRVNDITSRILALSSQSQRISEIIDLIDTMAGQTHILALNAAVESAGAGGEIGERFGVVASEVKKLAQRSAAATREVRAVIAQVQAATNAAVMATEDGLKETEKGVGLAHQSGDANEGIIGMVERTTQLANAISLATQQQRTASEQVVATMREIAAGTRQATRDSRQAAHAAADLSDIAGELRATSTGFHLPDDRDSPSPPIPAGSDTRRILLQPSESAL